MSKPIVVSDIQNKKETMAFFTSDFYIRLIEDLSEEALAWRISYELGGLRYYIPNKVTKNHFFAKFGEKFFIWLVKNYGGEAIIFPSGANNQHKRNKVQAENLALKGYSHNEIAKMLGLHYNSARRAKKRITERSLIEKNNT